MKDRIASTYTLGRNALARRNYLVEGVSGSGKTSVAEELQRRGFHVVHGDRELSYVGDPVTCEPLSDVFEEGLEDRARWCHEHHIWDVQKVRSLVADKGELVTFFCGGSRDFRHFIELFDGVFILDVDRQNLEKRLAERPIDEFGGHPCEKALIFSLHATKQDLPQFGVVINANQPLWDVVDQIVFECNKAS